MKRYRIESVPEKCKACRKCEITCIAIHHGLTFKEAMKLRDKVPGGCYIIKTANIKTTVSCRQCKDAPCVAVCPMHALRQDADGIVRIDRNQCSGCEMCALACPYGVITLENASVFQGNTKTLVDCHHCAEAPCIDACPPGALSKGEDGKLYVDKSICTACLRCVEVCPYSDISQKLSQSVGSELMVQPGVHSTAMRCDQCREWMVKEGKDKPACVEACPVGARVVLELDD